jgi:hypothetical protein
MGAETQNCTITLLRGSTVNQYGDEIDANDPLMTGIPATLIETGKSVQDPSTPTPRTIRQVYCSVPYWTGVLSTDRIMDERNSEVFMILSVTTPPTTIGAPVDLVLQLKRVSANAS